MSGFGGLGTIAQSMDLIFMFLNWTTSLFVVIGALMVRGKRMLRDLLIALLLFAVDSWFLLLFTGDVDVDFPLAWVLMPKRSHKVSRKFLVMECKKLGRKEFHKWYGILCSELDRLKQNIQKFIPLNAFVVMGREDFVFIQPALEELEPYKDTIPLTIMEECGHVCSLQKWREFNVIARKFFIEDRTATA